MTSDEKMSDQQSSPRELQEKDEAYRQRNVLVAALARLFPSGVRKTNIEGWSDDWHGCVYIDLPTGQISYHYHDSQSDFFVGLPTYMKPWDGHGKEEVERRLLSLQSEIGAQTNAAAQVQSAPKAQAKEKEETVRHDTGPASAAPQVEKSETPSTNVERACALLANVLVALDQGVTVLSPIGLLPVEKVRYACSEATNSLRQLERELNAARSATEKSSGR